MLKLALPYITGPITSIINTAITTRTFPPAWKHALITPIFKGGDGTNPNNYRPTSVLPILSKILERHIQKMINIHLLKHNLLNDMQSGFRKNHSCVTATHSMYSDWLDALRNKEHTIVTLLDFRKAFLTS